jgi:ribosomal protein S18 acetylase RimI-like enzyme
MQPSFEIIIRRVHPEEAGILSILAKTTFYDTFIHSTNETDMSSYLDEFYSIEQLQKELDNPDDECYFALHDGIPIAYMRFMEDYNNFPEINKWKALELKRIYVLQSFLGKGIAQRLMDFYLEQVKIRNYEVAWLGVWEHNTRAQRFYIKYGFSFSGYTHDFPIANTPQTDHWYWRFFIENQV